MSKLILNVGGMFSGKTTQLKKQGERHMLAGQRVIFVKPSIDNRYGTDCVVTHNGDSCRAMEVDCSATFYYLIPEGTHAVCIDEVQFFSVGTLVDTVNRLLSRGINVYCSGLDLDFWGIPFDTTAHLMAIADDVIKHHAVCERCGADAVFSYRKETCTSKELVELGAKDKYEALCRECYTERRSSHNEQ